jgi:type I restriction enzyme, S subunit
VEIADVADGDHATFPNEPDGTVVYLQARDFDGFVNTVGEAYVSNEYFAKNQRSVIGPNTVLISIMGTVGRVGLTQPDFVACMANRAVGIIRPHAETLPSVLFAYLRSRIAQDMILAYSSGGVQQRINLDLLRQLPVPKLSKALQEAIDDCVSEGFKAWASAMMLAEEAEKETLAALGLANWQPPEPLTYVVPASEVFAADRIDAEYHHPTKAAFLHRLSVLPGKRLDQHYQAIREMFDPSKAQAGEIVRNFDLNDALQPALDDETPTMLASQVGSSKKRFRPGDIVLSRLRVYLREIALVRTSPSIPAVGSSEFIVLRPIDAEEPKLSRAALLTFLRSKPVQTILRWSQDGSHHPRFGEEDLMCIPVPDAVCAVSSRVERLFDKTLGARTKARAFLAKAKQAVEIGIEDSEAAALRYLKEN